MFSQEYITPEIGKLLGLTHDGDQGGGAEGSTEEVEPVSQAIADQTIPMNNDRARELFGTSCALFAHFMPRFIAAILARFKGDLWSRFDNSNYVDKALKKLQNDFVQKRVEDRREELDMENEKLKRELERVEGTLVSILKVASVNNARKVVKRIHSPVPWDATEGEGGVGSKPAEGEMEGPSGAGASGGSADSFSERDPNQLPAQGEKKKTGKNKGKKKAEQSSN